MGQSNKIIIVTGATGKQGSAAARKLRARGWEVRGISRDPTKPAARILNDLGAEVVKADLSDEQAVRDAMKNAYGVFCALTWIEGIDIEMKQARIVADAAKQAGVEHFVYSSVGGAERWTGIPHFGSKWENEKYINSIDLPWTILRPVSFFENYNNPSTRASILSGRLPSPLPPGRSLQMIAVDDIGGFACMAFEDRQKWLKTATEIAGDERTMPEVAEAFGRVLGRNVTYEGVAMDAMDVERQKMNRWFDEEGYRANIPALRRIRPGLMTLEQWLTKGSWVTERQRMAIHA